MGFFSKCCAKTFRPVVFADPWALRVAPHLARVVALTPRKKIFAEYDGYGMGLSDEWDQVKFVLQDCYAGETFEQLPSSMDDPLQGFFISPELMEVLALIPSFPSGKDYVELTKFESHQADATSNQLLRGLGLLDDTTEGYRVRQALQYVSEMTGDPENDEYEVRKYTAHRANRPELVKLLPENPLDLKAKTDEYFVAYSKQMRALLLDKAAPFISQAS